jgi:hypothetical protein
METTIQIETPKKERDFFPSVFANKDNTIIILADSRTSDKTFSGTIVHSNNSGKNALLGTYSTGWTYAQFSRLPKGSKLTLTITQEG